MAKNRSATPRRSDKPVKRQPAAEKSSGRPSAPPECAIVGIGASAGGLEALTELLAVLPPDTGMAYVFIQHLDPKHKSLLTELLARKTQMPVCEVTNGMRAAPNQVHVIPRNTSMTVVKGILRLIPRPEPRANHLPVDQFFRSLAEDRHSSAIGVILSGTASDGALGLKAIKAAGGITFAQEESSAKYDGMPRSAIAAGGVDFVLTPAGIAAELVRISRHPYVLSSHEAPEARLPPETADSFNRILAALRFATGVDFFYYKATTVRRRILRRMHFRRIESLEKYAGLVRDDPQEIRSLFNDILINVTEFFRDPETFVLLKEKVFPQILGQHEDEPVRIWVPGCSTGEEVYSIAIALREFLEEAKREADIQIFGTDISDDVLTKARAGIYPSSISQDVSTDRLRRYFAKHDGGFQIVKRIREMCIFANQNLAKDPPFSRLDLISCRNVLIYLGPVLQKKVLPIFHYALRPSGYLVLGSSESIGLFSELFSPVGRKHKLYARRPVASRVPLDFSVADLRLMPREEPNSTVATDTLLHREADRTVLHKYGPPGLVIDGSLNIVQFRGHTGAFLEPPSGAATLNVLKMAREGLMVDLRNAIQRCRKDGAAFRRDGMRIRTEGGVREFNLEVAPLASNLSPKNRHMLILFEPIAPHDGQPVKSRREKKSAATDNGDHREVEQLRADLATTREYLQAIIEEQEATNEELRSANEEIQSSNEELQSANEELETAKEELQSTNEELNTVNEELKNRNLQLALTTNDLVNLLSNVSIPIIMVGNDFRIRRFTPISERMLNLIATDIGRPITDIRFPIEVPNLGQLIAEVIETLAPKSLEVGDGDGRSFSLRIRPYRTEENKIDGVVVVLVDLDPSRQQLDTDLDMITNSRAAQVLATETALIQRRDHLQALASQLLTAQEEEGRRIARELHDDLGQRLASLDMRLREVTEEVAVKTIRDRLRSLEPDLEQLMADVNSMAYQLHPSKVEDLGLTAALRSLVQDFEKQHGIHVRFTATPIPKSVTAPISLALYRIAQEALRNVARHSGASKATIALYCTPQAIRLTVRDFGRGMNVDPEGPRAGLGITSMEERARLVDGIFAISTDRGGTQVNIHVPLKDEME